MDTFAIKAAMIDNDLFFDTLTNPKKISSVETNISRVLENLSAKDVDLDSRRRKALENMLILGNLLNKSKDKNVIEEDFSSFKEYENALVAEKKNKQEIIRYLGELIENEHFDILFDIREPLKLFDAYFGWFEKSVDQLINSRPSLFTDKSNQTIKNLFTNISYQYSDLCAKIMVFIEKELSCYDSLGVIGLGKTSSEIGFELQNHLKERTRIKNELMRQTLLITNEIEKLEVFLKNLSKQPELANLDVNITAFTNIFKKIIKACMDRVEIAHFTIIESLNLQKKIIKELDQMRSDAERLSTKISSTSTQPKKIVEEIKVFTETVSKDIAEQELKDISALKQTSVQTKKIVQSITKSKTKLLTFGQKFRRRVLLPILIAGIVGGSAVTAMKHTEAGKEIKKDVVKYIDFKYSEFAMGSNVIFDQKAFDNPENRCYATKIDFNILNNMLAALKKAKADKLNDRDRMNLIVQLAYKNSNGDLHNFLKLVATFSSNYKHLKSQYLIDSNGKMYPASNYKAFAIKDNYDKVYHFVTATGMALYHAEQDHAGSEFLLNRYHEIAEVGSSLTGSYNDRTGGTKKNVLDWADVKADKAGTEFAHDLQKSLAPTIKNFDIGNYVEEFSLNK